MKIEIHFNATNLREALTDAAVESMPPDALEHWTVLAAREDRYREALCSWIDGDGQIAVEFDTEAGSARVLRRDGKEEDGDAVTRALRLAEWGGWDTDVEDNCCPVCGAFEDSVTGHAEGCAIAEALRIPHWRQGPGADEPEGGAEPAEGAPVHVPDDVLQRAAALAVGLLGSWFEPVKGEPEGGAE